MMQYFLAKKRKKERKQKKKTFNFITTHQLLMSLWELLLLFENGTYMKYVTVCTHFKIYRVDINDHYEMKSEAKLFKCWNHSYRKRK